MIIGYIETVMKIPTIISILLVFTATTFAQRVDRPTREDDPVILLARSCVSERGWAHDTDDCAAIAEVVRGRMDRTGEDFATAIRGLAPRLHGPEWIGTRPWLQDLALDAHRPRFWPGSAWELRPGCEGEERVGRCRVSRREDWLRTVEHARAILDGAVPSPCAVTPPSWGARRDVRLRLAHRARERAAAGLRPDRMTFHELECGRTLNLFGCYVRPGERWGRDRTTSDDVDPD